jgi:membrane protein DedA with SNARE-associated domain/rhodanese-related sulfurtransferase
MSDLISLVHDYGAIVVFVAALVDEAGAPIPCYPVLLAAGASALTGAAVTTDIAAAAAGIMIADAFWYAAGIRFGRRMLSLMCRLTLSPDSCVQSTQVNFARFGLWTLPLSKFIPGLRYIAVAMAGITRMGRSRFLAYDGAGAVVYVTLPVVLGRLFHDSVNQVLDVVVRLGGYGLILVVTLLAFYIGLRWFERHAFARRLRMARISVPELLDAMATGRAPVIFDVRDPISRLTDGMIPGAVAAHLSEIDAIAAQYARDREIVIYCACPNEASAAIAALHLKRAGFTLIRPLLGGIDAWMDSGGRLERVERPAAE